MAPDRRPEPDPEPNPERLLELIGAGWTTQVVRASVELGIVDALADGPGRAADLAEGLDADPAALARLLRALCTIELCTPVGDGLVALTPTGALLAAGEGSLGPWARWWGGPVWAEWGQLPEAVRTGRPVRPGDGFASAGDAAATFDASMAALAAIEAPGVVAALELRGDELVVDIGGGTGTVLAALLAHHPTARGLLVERPQAVAVAQARFAAVDLADRCDAVVGDLFDPAPPGGDVYLLKNVLHDWDDARAGRILRGCAAGAGPGARILVVERVVAEPADPSIAARSTARMDLHMLLAHGGRERTEPEHRELLSSAGLFVQAVRSCRGPLAVIEAVVQSA